MPFVPGMGIVVAQDPLTATDPAEQVVEIKARHEAAITEAIDYLLSIDFDPWEIVELDITSRKVRRVYWSDEFGSVYPDHPDAHLSLFVEVPILDLPDLPDVPEPPQPVEVTEA
jgi:hypothetical protein